MRDPFLVFLLVTATAAASGCAGKHAAIETPHAHPGLDDRPPARLDLRAVALAEDALDRPAAAGSAGAAEAAQAPAVAPSAAGGVFACPMHPEVVAEAAGRCPRCDMRLVAGGAP